MSELVDLNSNTVIVSTDGKEIIKQLFDKSSESILPKNTIFLVGSNKLIQFETLNLERFINEFSFLRLFYSKLKSKNEPTIIRIETIEPNQFLYFLRYFYGKKIIIRHQEIAFTCLGAKENSILDLSSKLIESCDRLLSIYNVAIVYDQYLKLNDNLISANLINRAEEMICLHASLVFKSNFFLKISKETLIKLLQNSSLFIKEKEIYYAVLDWINNEIERQEKKINSKNQIELFNEFKQLIRFPLMTKKQFDNLPLKNQFFSLVELRQFDEFFSNQNALSINYNSNERNALMIYKLQFDKETNQYRQLDRFHNEKNDNESEIDEKLIDFVGRERFMTTKFKATYFKDGIRKRKFQDTENDLEAIYVFKFGIKIERKIWNDELLLEIHENGQKLDLNLLTYTKSGKFYFSLCSPIALINSKEYRICLRTRNNQCFYNNLKIDNVITLDENECKIDVQFRVLDKDISVADKMDIYFVYKENYVIEDESIKDEIIFKDSDDENSIENWNPNEKKKSSTKSQRKKRKIIDDSETEID